MRRVRKSKKLMDDWVAGTSDGHQEEGRSAHMVRRWEGCFNWAKAGKASKGLNVVEHGVYPVFYSDFLLFLLLLLSPPEAFLAFAQSKRPSQHLTMRALPFFFLTPIRRPGIPVVHRLLWFPDSSYQTF
jgi:hypothetical protein